MDTTEMADPLTDILGTPEQQWTVVGVWFKPETDGFIPIYMVNVINAETAERAVMVFIQDCVTQHGVGSEDDVGICSVFRGNLTPGSTKYAHFHGQEKQKEARDEAISPVSGP